MDHSPAVAVQHNNAARQVAAAQRHAINLALARRGWGSMGLRIIEEDVRRIARSEADAVQANAILIAAPDQERHL